MTATQTRPVMPPKKTTPEDGDRKATSTARLPVELLRQARVVAAFQGIDLGDYLVGLLTGPVGKDYKRIVRDEEK